MTLEEHIDDIRNGLRAGRFVNEAAICQGIVLRLLHALSWPTYDPRVVCPEFSLAGRRVDFALCHPPAKPRAFVEVKKPGQSDGAEKQLFEYAFHEGVPLAILTNGQEWSFFLPGEQGSYGDRRVYKLDFLEREVFECAIRLRRYLDHARVADGTALSDAREDYKSVARQRDIEANLPQAWHRIVADEDEALIQLLADRVEALCGFKPDPDRVVAFLRRLPKHQREPAPAAQPPQRPSRAPEQALHPPAPKIPVATAPSPDGSAALTSGFTIDGKRFPTRSAFAVLRETMLEFQRRDPSFFERFAALPKHGRSRRYLARSPEELIPERPDLSVEHAEDLGGGWYLCGNLSRRSIRNIIEMACDVAGVPFGSRYILQLAD